MDVVLNHEAPGPQDLNWGAADDVNVNIFSIVFLMHRLSHSWGTRKTLRIPDEN